VIIPIEFRESRREAKPLLKNVIPLSFEGEGDKGGEVDKESIYQEAGLKLAAFSLTC